MRPAAADLRFVHSQVGPHGIRRMVEHLREIDGRSPPARVLEVERDHHEMAVAALNAQVVNGESGVDHSAGPTSEEPIEICPAAVKERGGREYGVQTGVVSRGEGSGREPGGDCRICRARTLAEVPDASLGKDLAEIERTRFGMKRGEPPRGGGTMLGPIGVVLAAS